MIPPLSRRRLSLETAILDRKQVRKNAPLIHRHTEQLAAIAGLSAQRLARIDHALILALQLGLVLAALLGLEELPCSVDCPVA